VKYVLKLTCMSLGLASLQISGFDSNSQALDYDSIRFSSDSFEHI